MRCATMLWRNYMKKDHITAMGDYGRSKWEKLASKAKYIALEADTKRVITNKGGNMIRIAHISDTHIRNLKYHYLSYYF